MRQLSPYPETTLPRVVHVACGMWHVACGMWHVACGMWHVACGMWHVACGMWHVPKRLVTNQHCKESANKTSAADSLKLYSAALCNEEFKKLNIPFWLTEEQPHWQRTFLASRKPTWLIEDPSSCRGTNLTVRGPSWLTEDPSA